MNVVPGKGTMRMTELVSEKDALVPAPERKHRMMRSVTVDSDGPNVPLPSRWIPVPDVPIWPVLSTKLLSNDRHALPPSIIDAGTAVYLLAGRVAIGLALKLAGVQKGDKVLLPAFHCTSMVDPLTVVSAAPVFYRLGEDLRVDLEDIANKIDADTRALIATNYFGFPQDLEKLRKFCDDNDLVFIEDCAHSFFGEFAGRPLGSYGHYAIGSLTKFFPVKVGGCLVSNDPQLGNLTMRRYGFEVHLRQLIASIEDANYCHRLALLSPLVRGMRVLQRLLSHHGSESGTVESARTPTSELDAFDPDWMDIEVRGVVKWISRHVPASRLAKRRRENYHRMLAHFAGLPGCRPLITNVPDGVVPYMFPLLVDNLAAVFPRLEDLAVPVQRFGQFLWSGVDETTCPHSARYSKHLIQLPCHQDLRDEELDWILATVSNVIKASRA